MLQQNAYTSLRGSNLTDPVPQTATRQLLLLNSQNRINGRKRNAINGVAHVSSQVGHANPEINPSVYQEFC